VKIICDRYITISFQKKILNTVRHKNIVTAAVILVIALASFLLPIAAYSQLPYLPNIQLSEKNQGNQGRIIMLTDNVSNNSIVSIPRNAIGSSSKNNNKVVIINFDAYICTFSVLLHSRVLAIESYEEKSIHYPNLQ